MFDTLRFRKALAAHMGYPLTPERAAAIEAMACAAPAPLPILTEDEQRVISISQDLAHFEFVSRALGGWYSSMDSVALAAVGPAGELRAVVAFTDFRRWSAEILVATDGSRRWLSRTFLRACCRYPFQQLGLRRLTGRVESTNERAIKLNTDLGAKREGVQRHQFGPNDAILFGMLREECPWLKE